MSQLALSTDGWLMEVAFCTTGIGILLAALCLRRLVPMAVTAPLILAFTGLLYFVAAAFQTDPTGVPLSVHGTISQHGRTGNLCAAADCNCYRRVFIQEALGLAQVQPPDSHLGWTRDLWLFPPDRAGHRQFIRGWAEDRGRSQSGMAIDRELACIQLHWKPGPARSLGILIGDHRLIFRRT